MSESPVLQAMRSVPRELFVPTELRHLAYRNTAFAISHGKTISKRTMGGRQCQFVPLVGPEAWPAVVNSPGPDCGIMPI